MEDASQKGAEREREDGDEKEQNVVKREKR